MKILLLIPNVNIARYTLPEWLISIKPDIPHTGISQLAAFLKNKGHDVTGLDLRFKSDRKILFRHIEEYKPDLIGITATSYRLSVIYNLIDHIKKKYSLIKVVIGGPHVSSVKKDVLRDCKADFAVKHEGEYTFLELLASLKDRTDLSSVKGLIYRKDNQIIENEDRPLIDNLDVLPFPDYDIFNLSRYYSWEHKIIPILTSRGCPYNCVFCSVKLSMGRRFRARSAKNVLEEIKYWYNKGFKKFDFNDDCFTLDPKRVNEICDLIISNKLKIEFRLHNGIRVDRVTQDLLKKMRDAGCTTISYGIETGNKDTLLKIKKGITFEQVQNAIDWSKQLGIKTIANFMIGHPDETYEKALDTLEMAKKINADFINFNNTIPFPGSELFEWIKINGRFIHTPKEYLGNMGGNRMRRPLFETKEFTAKERKKILREGVNIFRKRHFEYSLKKPWSALAYFLSKSDILYGMMEFVKKTTFFNKIRKIIF
jgi:anaerobic magnesium-protoporphyrin IX monomethyl ester cyclase